MESKLSPVPVPPDLSSGQPQARPAASMERAELLVTSYTAAPSSDLRLVIEPHGSSYVYKTIDRRTGEIVSQYPVEEILKMMSEQRYTAGVVISTIA